MKQLSILLLLALTGAAYGGDRTRRTLTVEGKPVKLVAEDDHDLTISAECVKGATYNCAAYAALQRAGRLELAPDKVRLGATPGSVACGELGGVVVIATDRKANESAFCRFGDASLVACGSLASRLPQPK